MYSRLRFVFKRLNTLQQDVLVTFLERHTFSVKTNKQTNSLCDKDQADTIIWENNEFIAMIIPDINTLYRQNKRIIQIKADHSYSNHFALIV